MARLKEQMEFLHTSLRGFYAGDFAESVRIATVIRVLVHESGMSKPSGDLVSPRVQQRTPRKPQAERKGKDTKDSDLRSKAGVFHRRQANDSPRIDSKTKSGNFGVK